MKSMTFRKCLSYVILLAALAVAPRLLEAQLAPTESNEVSRNTQVAELDSQITDKTNLMNLYRAKSTRFRNQGDRLQFNSENVTEARRYWQLAEYYNAEADRLQNEIGQLRTKRSDLINRNK